MVRSRRFGLKVCVLVLALSFIGTGSIQVYAEYRPTKDTAAQVIGEKKYRTDQFIIEVSSFKEAKRIAKENGLEVKKAFRTISRARNGWVGVFKKSKSNQQSIERIVQKLHNRSGVRHVGLDHVVHIADLPNDPKFSDLWGLHNIGQTNGTEDADIDALEAWELTTGSSDVIIAVIDTGVDYNHPDLVPNMWRNAGEIPGNGVDDDGNGYIDDVYGIDTVNDDGDPMDDNYHGTHVAGTIGAKGNDGFGVVGINWNVKIMALKFLDSSGSGYTSDAVECLDYIIAQKQKGQNVVASNNSWGGGGHMQNLYEAIETAGNAGILFVAAAGNNSSDNNETDYYPANYDSEYVITVAATDDDDRLASFSNWGSHTVDLGAPGVRIVSCAPDGGFKTLSGTSMATPHVCASIGLLASIFPDDTALERKNRILNYVEPIAALSDRTITGGRLNIDQAVRSEPFVIAKYSWSKDGELTRVFKDESVAYYSNVVSWHWDFGDGSTAIAQNSRHTYSFSGWYDVTLTVRADSGAEDSFTKSIWAGPNLVPTADFTYSTPGGFVGKFTSQSSDLDGVVEGWTWDFGDGEMSSERNPSHQYRYPGTYTVALTVTDDEGGTGFISKEVVVPLTYCSSSSLTSGPIAVSNVQISSFSNPSDSRTYSDFMDKTIHLSPGRTYDTTITMDDDFWKQYTRIYIDYNLDGVFSDENEVVFESSGKGYTQIGNITVPSGGVVQGRKVGLRVSSRTSGHRDVCSDRDGWGEVEDYTVIFDNNGNQPPTAGFTSVVDELNVSFTDESMDPDGTVGKWLWDFGDGNTSVQQNTSHIYAVSGTYAVKLTVTDNEGASDSVSKKVTVFKEMENRPPTAAFAFAANALAVTFTDQSVDPDGTVKEWMWEFGDGKSATTQSPNHTYAAAGTYTVKLTVTDNEGATGSVSKQVTVSDDEGGEPEYCESRSFSYSAIHIKQVDVGAFSNSSTGTKYSDFSQMTVNLNKGETVSLSLTPFTNSRIWDGYWRIWVDYNGDGDYDDSGELVFENFMKDQDGQPLEGSFTVPSSGVVTGQKLGMRVSLKNNRYRDVCSKNGWGEVEDYTVNIQ